VSKHVQRENEEAVELARETLRHLAWLRSAGVQEVPWPSSSPPPGTAGAVPAGEVDESGPPVLVAPPGTPHSDGEGNHVVPARAEPRIAPTPTAVDRSATAARSVAAKGCGSPALLAIREHLGECARCKLAAGRTHLVFGVGNPRAELMFIGEGPGADEDQQGEPFVGKAGQLLTKMIEAMGFRREDVYIANVVKCRPPGNRNPEPDEIAACEPFLGAQIAAISPKVIVALGKFAAQTLLRDTTPISRLRGSWTSYGGVKLMPTFHPAYLLRSPEEKKRAWEDLQLVMKELGRALPRR
jgi:uracil-DNA glycosylase family 4